MKPKRGRPPTRSELMGRIRGQDTRPEQIFRSALWAAGLRYRVQYPTPAGRVDIAFPGSKLVVQVHGCFWHGCPDHYVRPRSNEGFWADKLRANIGRDRLQVLTLEGLGWRVLGVWEHSVFLELDRVVARVMKARDGEVPDPREEPEWRVAAVEPVGEAGQVERRLLEALRDPGVTRVLEGPRRTTKWRRPRSG